MTDTVTLANGKTVSLDEFLTWNFQKQSNNLMPRRTFGKRRDGFAEEQSARIKDWWDERRKNGPVIAVNRGVPHSEETKRKIGLKTKERMAGVAKSDDHRLAMSEAGKAAWVKRRGWSKLVTPAGTFESVKAAAAGVGVIEQTLRKRLRDMPGQYYTV
jgi:hypothetical protein